MYTTRKASTTPEQDIMKISYEGQPETSRLYQTGWEKFMDELPVMTNENVENTLPVTQHVMKELSHSLKNHINGFNTFPNIAHLPKDGQFHRTIVAMESPQQVNDWRNDSGMYQPKYKEGAELVVAKWGKGFSSPVHGHSTGYMHEEVLKGKIKVNTYRIVDLPNKIVKPYKTEIIGEGVFVSDYAPENESDLFKRQTLIHNFEAIEPSLTLHYLPEHTRDGRDNTFKVENYTDRMMLTPEEVTRITARDGMYLKKGEVLLVRSENVPEYGDHFVVVTGSPIMKDHGLRIQDVSIPAGELDSKFLDRYEVQTGLVLLKLVPATRDAFLAFHDIQIIDNEVVFPKL